MKNASNHNELATLSSVLLSNLDEVVFFAKLTGFVQDIMGEHKVLGFEVLSDGCTRLLSENGQALSSAKLLNKGQGLSGYVARMKRAYYSNSVKRDPIASSGHRDDSVEAELCVPVMVDGSVIGTINVQSIKKDRSFSELDIAAINDILTQLQSPILLQVATVLFRFRLLESEADRVVERKRSHQQLKRSWLPRENRALARAVPQPLVAP